MTWCHNNLAGTTCIFTTTTSLLQPTHQQKSDNQNLSTVVCLFWNFYITRVFISLLRINIICHDFVNSYIHTCPQLKTSKGPIHTNVHSMGHKVYIFVWRFNYGHTWNQQPLTVVLWNCLHCSGHVYINTVQINYKWT